jgi:ABC-2 type transport system permease protein
MVLLILSIIILFVRNIMYQTYIEKEEKQKIEEYIKTSQSSLSLYLDALERNPKDEEAKKLLQIIDPILESLYELRDLVATNDWQKKLTLENKFLNHLYALKKSGSDNPLSYTEINHKIALNQKLLDEDIIPEHETYSIALPNFMKQIIDFYTSFGAIIIILLLIGDILSSEFENRSIHLLFTQPLKKTHIINSKFFNSLIVYLFTTCIILITTIIIGLIFGEKGSFAYPILIEKNHSVDYLTITDYMIQSIIVTSVTVIMVFSLCMLYSLLLKHTLATLFVLFGTLLGGYILTLFITWKPFAWINPFQYLLPENTIVLQNEHVWYQGIPITVLLTVVFYLISLLKIRSSKME